MFGGQEDSAIRQLAWKIWQFRQRENVAGDADSDYFKAERYYRNGGSTEWPFTDPDFRPFQLRACA